MARGGWAVVWLVGCGSSMNPYGTVRYDPETDEPESDDEGAGPANAEPDEPEGPQDSGLVNAAECEWVEVGLPTGSAPAQTQTVPTWITVSFVGIVEEGTIYDYQVDGERFSATLRFDLFDEANVWLCEVIYDASGATEVSPWATSSGGRLWAAYDVPLGDSASTCAGFGGRDIRDLIEQYSWGIGFGPLVDLAGPMEDSVSASGGDWVNDWEPYTFGTYVRSDWFDATGAAVEAGYASSYAKDCDAVMVDADGFATAIPTPTGPLGDFLSTGPVLAVSVTP